VICVPAASPERTSSANKRGRYLLHGTETWYDEDGKKRYEVTYTSGRKIGPETYWVGGEKRWTRDHRKDGTSLWTQLWPGGRKKAESTWRNLRAHGTATCWDRAGKVISKVQFADGAVVK
jgi:antitoxin component YwqK of YwqJK toxin-antitoxin module